MDLSKIKATIKLPKNNKDQEIDMQDNLHVPGLWGGSTIVVRWSEIIANPVLAIKKDKRLAFRTNATPEQIEFITEQSVSELKKNLSDGKEVSRNRGDVGKAVPLDKKDKK